MTNSKLIISLFSNRTHETVNGLKIQPHSIIPFSMEIEFEKITLTRPLTKELL